MAASSLLNRVGSAFDDSTLIQAIKRLIEGSLVFLFRRKSWCLIPCLLFKRATKQCYFWLNKIQRYKSYSMHSSLKLQYRQHEISIQWLAKSCRTYAVLFLVITTRRRFLFNGIVFRFWFEDSKVKMVQSRRFER